MRAEVQLFLYRRRRPALTNLGRRKPRGLVATYGERAQAGEADFATGAASSVLGALAAVIFRHLDRGHSVDWALTMQFEQSFWMMAASGISRSAKDDRSLSKCLVKHRIMRPAPVLVHATSVFDRAGRSR